MSRHTASIAHSTALCVVLWGVAGERAAADEASTAGAELGGLQETSRQLEFGRDIAPLLTRCRRCHGPAKQKGGLRLDVRERMMRGGDSGPAFVAGDSAASLLIRRVAASDPDAVMPPTGPRLTEREIGLLRLWIDQGARSAAAARRQRPSSDLWSLAPLEKPPVPRVEAEAWVRNPIDAFVLSRLEGLGIEPSRQAERHTLLRRLYLDLTGLTPSADAAARFLSDENPHAYDRLVDRLLASPHFGERWGRHWLDVARYADTDGYEKDLPRPYAWRYRDWVLSAVNRDLPFDRFSIEQLAGDLLESPTLEEKVATGFHRNTLTNREGGVDEEEFRVKATVDRTNTTGGAWLGLTVGCAQCHTHKYDPITQREYYELFAFFNNATEVDIDAPLAGEAEADRRAKVRTLAEAAPHRDTHVLVRGDFLRPGAQVSPGTPGVLPPLRARGKEPDRLDLARWLVDAENPLTPRVAVNRVWQHLFGRGIVASPGDFGTRGERPSHPALLDWLAGEYMRRGWSRKSMIRLIVTSATYRQASEHRADLRDVDPGNELLARQSRLRLEAEVLRDVFLRASGLMTRSIGGPSVRPPLPPGMRELGYANSVKWPEDTGAARFRRGLYIFLQRTVPYPLLTTFDAPDSSVSCLERRRSNTPLQALTLLNDPVFFECARALGARLARDRRAPPRQRLADLFLNVVSRRPDPHELEELEALYEDVERMYRRAPGDAARAAAGAAADGLEAVETAAWTAVARVVLNLDEAVTRS